MRTTLGLTHCLLLVFGICFVAQANGFAQDSKEGQCKALGR